MARKNPPIPPPDHFTAEVTPDLTYSIELATPMVGGGVKSYVPDMKTPVRASAVKGQLRFWWRTLQANLSQEELLQKESAIWGGAAGASDTDGVVSAVRMRIDGVKGVEQRTLEKNDGGYMDYEEFPGYVLFPFQGQEETSFTLITACTFTLQLHCPQEYLDEVERSVKLWLLFGGIGARTSRGCGSLYCKEVMQEFQTPAAISAFLHKCAGSAVDTSPFPVLAGGTLAVTESSGAAVGGWKTCLDRYGDFRQKNARGGPQNRGRTRWADADGVRLMTGQSGTHEPRYTEPYFPRAAYGLPVQIEFRNDPTDPQGKFNVQPAEAERWPSPFILKAVKLSEEKHLKVCLLLNSKIPEKLVLHGGRFNHKPIPPEAHPDNWENRELQEGAHGQRLPDRNPYTALFKALGLQEVTHG